MKFEPLMLSVKAFLTDISSTFPQSTTTIAIYLSSLNKFERKHFLSRNNSGKYEYCHNIFKIARIRNYFMRALKFSDT